VRTGVLLPDDPAYWMLAEGRARPELRSNKTVHKDGCFICEDPEFALMGLPLCSACDACGGHVPADDSVCTDCGHDQRGHDELEGLP
jgi:hypothetical protein